MSWKFRFEPRAASYSWINADALARAAELAYCDGAHVEETALGWGLSQIRFIDSEETQVFVGAGKSNHDEPFVIVAFRGTERDSLADWITDAQVSLVKGPLEGRVHEGFYEALSEVWRMVDDTVRRFAAPGHTLWLTGHSLGGAVAALAAARWLERRRPVHGVYTYGQPRTGDPTFARNFNFAFKPRTFRFVNGNDLVTRIPPRALGYSHLGTFRYFTETGVFAEDRSWWTHFLSEWSFQIEDLFESGDLFDFGFSDHGIDQYRARISSSMPRPPVTTDALRKWIRLAAESKRGRAKGRRAA